MTQSERVAEARTKGLPKTIDRTSGHNFGDHSGSVDHSTIVPEAETIPHLTSNSEASRPEIGDHSGNVDHRGHVPAAETIHTTETDSGSSRPDLRFVDPLVQDIRAQWRQRQALVKAQTKLTLQIKALCRAFCAGDKKEADVLYAALNGKGEHPAAHIIEAAAVALVAAQQPLIEARKKIEKHLEKLAKSLPIAGAAAEIRGLGYGSLAALVGEAGCFSAYRSHQGLWKRLGMAVIDGERQRRVSDVEKALEHGYSPERRAVAWNVGTSLMRAQKPEDPYRKVYDERKAYEAERVETAGHAHNRAVRYMTKSLIRDLYKKWRKETASA